jgi:hypothetical protein
MFIAQRLKCAAANRHGKESWQVRFGTLQSERWNKKRLQQNLKGLLANAGRGQCRWSGRHPMKGIALLAMQRRIIE